jgi:hypothetical protein
MNLPINKYYFSLTVIFTFFFIWSTIELNYYNLVDLDGDATWYFETAINKLYYENFYPIYPLFISYLGLDNPLFTRFLQFLILLLITVIIFKNINQKSWDNSIKKLFKLFYLTNFGLYLIMVQLVRDWMLFSLTIISILLFTSEKNNTLKTFISFFAIILLFPLSQTLPLILLSAYAIAYIQFNFIKSKHIIKTFFFISFFFLLYFFVKDYIQNILERSYNVIGGEKVLEDDAAKSNFFIGFFNFLFGPGLIRPLFPSKYYQVYTYYFTFLTWISCFSFLIQTSLFTSFFFKKDIRLNFSKNFFIYFYTFIIYVSIYVAAFGGPGGLRKRMLAYFLCILFASELFSTNLIFPLKKNILSISAIFLSILILLTTIFSL